MTTVFILWHSHPTGAGEMNEKLIGVYATEEEASSAIERLKLRRGFCDYLEGFEIAPYEIGKDHWDEGYFTA